MEPVEVDVLQLDAIQALYPVHVVVPLIFRHMEAIIQVIGLVHFLLGPIE